MCNPWCGVQSCGPNTWHKYNGLLFRYNKHQYDIQLGKNTALRLKTMATTWSRTILNYISLNVVASAPSKQPQNNLDVTSSQLTQFDSVSLPILINQCRTQWSRISVKMSRLMSNSDTRDSSASSLNIRYGRVGGNSQLALGETQYYKGTFGVAKLSLDST